MSLTSRQWAEQHAGERVRVTFADPARQRIGSHEVPISFVGRVYGYDDHLPWIVVSVEEPFHARALTAKEVEGAGCKWARANRPPSRGHWRRGEFIDNDIRFWLAHPTDVSLQVYDGVQAPVTKYPHRCPVCSGPAYVGFNDTVVCEKRCA